MEFPTNEDVTKQIDDACKPVYMAVVEMWGLMGSLTFPYENLLNSLLGLGYSKMIAEATLIKLAQEGKISFVNGGYDVELVTPASDRGFMQ